MKEKGTLDLLSDAELFYPPIHLTILNRGVEMKDFDAKYRTKS